jgi:soluble lytic murein transglycosylase-like protein
MKQSSEIRARQEPRDRAHVLLLVALVSFVALMTLAAAAGARGPLYRFIDEAGVIHFSNAPPDDRYRAISLKPTGLHLSQRRNPPGETRFDLIIRSAALAQGLEPALVKAVIAAESNFDPQAVSHKGAQGLMQLMPQTARSLGVTDSLVPSQNIDGGSRYLRAMLDRYGDVSRALAAYNAGPEAVDRYRGIPPYRETRAYVARVLTYYRGYYAETPK